MSDLIVDEALQERIVRAVEKVRNHLSRATAALDRHRIPYAVVGGYAVAAWVATADEAAVGNTQDVNIALRRADLEAAKVAMSEAVFVSRHASGIDMFLDGPDAKARDAVHSVFSGEKVRAEYAAPVPDVDRTESPGGYRVLSLEERVRMKLASFRRKDQVHLLDCIEVGLIDASWPARYPPELGERLQHLLDTPEG
ncbi:MAG: hypothetical protein U0800_22055 [Isosphaeraceae bacterium]